MHTALTIAGSDSSGGAGIQADLKTMTAHGIYGMSAITALTAQNTMGITAIMEVSPTFLEQELDAVFLDIYPDAVKTGMVSSVPLIHTIAQKLQQYHAHNIVVDPVMLSTSGARLLAQDAVDTLKQELLPLADLLTPNIPEAEILADIVIQNSSDMELAAKKISLTYKCNVLCKGGHQLQDANDYFYSPDAAYWYKGKRILTNNTHGTGCTLSSAIASNLASGMSMQSAISSAKDYLTGALCDMLDLGCGSGPVNHCYKIQENTYGKI